MLSGGREGRMVGVPPLTHDRLSNLLTQLHYALAVSMAVQFYTLSENTSTTVHQTSQGSSFQAAQRSAVSALCILRGVIRRLSLRGHIRRTPPVIGCRWGG